MTKVQEMRRQKAKELRYKKPIALKLNMDTIRDEMWDMLEACSEVAWACADEEALIDALDGSEEETFEFKMMFSTLTSDIESFQNDLNELTEWHTVDDIYGDEIFNLYFVAISKGNKLSGYDSYEEDYYPLNGWETEAAERESEKKLMRFNKSQIIELAQCCSKILINYVGIKYRYDSLETAIDILREKNTGYLQTIRDIEKAYETANEASEGFKYDKDEVRNLERLINSLPETVWIQ